MSLDVIERASSSALLTSVICLVTIFAILGYAKKYFYWPRRGIKGPRPIPFLGDFSWMIEGDTRLAELAKRRKYGKIYGTHFRGAPRLYVADAQVLRQILVKDFDAFPGRQMLPLANKYQELFLFFINGDQWKKVRAMMTPSFTSGKMKKMFKFMDGCADDLLDYLDELFTMQTKNRSNLKGASGFMVNMSETFSTYSMNGIATCGYGLRLRRDQLDEQEKGATRQAKGGPVTISRQTFIEYADKVLRPRDIRLFIVSWVPAFILRLLGFSITTEKNFEPMVQCIKHLMKRRNLEQSKKHDDLLQLLLDARLDDKVELDDMDQAENHHAGLTKDTILDIQREMVNSASIDKRESGKTGNGTIATSQETKSRSQRLSEIEVLCQAVLMLSAGSETTSALLTNCIYSLAYHPDIQDRLYGELEQIVELDSTKKRHIFSYESLTSCQYLDSVISETLRILPPVPNTDRMADRDYLIEKYNILVPKGQSIQMGFRCVQNDPDYWPEPEKFDPERFMPENRDKIVPGSYLPFSMGPRHCIGMRFSLTEAKIGLAKLVMKYKFTPIPGLAYLPEVSFGSGLVRIKDSRVVFHHRL